MAGDIEFLGADPPVGDGDEFLPEPPRRRLPGSARGRRVAAVVAVAVLLGGGLIARVAAGSDSATPAPSRSPSATPSIVDVEPVAGSLTSPDDIFCGTGPGTGEGTATSAPSDTSAPINPTSQGTRASSAAPSRAPSARAQGPEAGAVQCSPDDAALCPRADDGLSACTSAAGLPSAVLVAVREHYPGADRVRFETLITRETDRVWFRRVELHQGAVTILVTVQQAGHYAGGSGDVDDGNQDIVRAVHRGKDTSTIVEVTQPSGRAARSGSALALAADPRLLAVR